MKYETSSAGLFFKASKTGKELDVSLNEMDRLIVQACRKEAVADNGEQYEKWDVAKCCTKAIAKTTCKPLLPRQPRKAAFQASGTRQKSYGFLADNKVFKKNSRGFTFQDQLAPRIR